MLREARHHLLERGRKLVHAAREADRTQREVGAQQRRHGRADAAAVVFEHRLDGFFVARVDRRPKSVVRRQQGRIRPPRPNWP